jgi:hypothetical protein
MAIKLIKDPHLRRSVSVMTGAVEAWAERFPSLRSIALFTVLGSFGCNTLISGSVSPVSASVNFWRFADPSGLPRLRFGNSASVGVDGGDTYAGLSLARSLTPPVFLPTLPLLFLGEVALFKAEPETFGVSVGLEGREAALLLLRFLGT